MGLGRHSSLKRQFGGTQHRLLIVMQDKRQYLDHLPVAADMLEKMALQLAERTRHLDKWRAVTQCTGLALDYRQIVLS